MIFMGLQSNATFEKEKCIPSGDKYELLSLNVCKVCMYAMNEQEAGTILKHRW